MINWRFLMAVALFATDGRAQSLFVDDVAIDVRAEPKTSVQIGLAQFENSLRLPARAPISPKELLNKRLDVKVATLEAKCSLTLEQRAKLLLAGRGDICRLSHEIELLRVEYVDRSLPKDELGNVQAEIFRRGTLPLIHPFTENSLFLKVLTKSLSADQYARYAKCDRDGRRVDVRIAMTSSLRGLYLTDAKESEIVELILQKLPKWRPVEPYSEVTGRVVLSQLQEELRPLLNDRQREQVQKHADFAIVMIPRLQSMGLWPNYDQEELPVAK